VLQAADKTYLVPLIKLEEELLLYTSPLAMAMEKTGNGRAYVNKTLLAQSFF
jgi:hypothetical protein